MFNVVNRQDVTHTSLSTPLSLIFSLSHNISLYLFLHGIRAKFLWPLTNIIAYFVVICGSIYWRILAQCGLALHRIFYD
jgi:hypothetical protein